MRAIWLHLRGALSLLAAPVRWLAHRRGPREGPFYTFRCPRCDQKIRSQASKAGRDGLCPRCFKRCTLPGATARPGG